jgi:gentisate 1,2-dioxygenase
MMTEANNSRQAYYGTLSANGLAPLWEVMKGLVPREPTPSMAARHWRWRELREIVLTAASVVTAEEAERRVIVLENPSFPGESRATNTLYAGIQLVMPGEVAPAHRHSQSALRFLIDGAGGFTAVDGERTTMAFGDFVITPSWTFHDHGNDGDGPVFWLDVLDVPITGFFQAGFSEPYPHARQSIDRAEGTALARFGSGMLPMTGPKHTARTSPIFNYPYARAREALAIGDPDPHWGHALRYANPVDGGWAMPTISAWLSRFPAGFRSKPLRSTDGMIVTVAEGNGEVRMGDTTFVFGPGDVMLLPNWTWRSVEASNDCVWFCASDRVVQEKLGLWREERG